MIAVAVAALVALAAIQASPPAVTRALPDCTRLTATLDGQDGAFNGMSHSGVLLILRNMGPSACKVPGLPSLRFLSRSGLRLAIARRAPAGMHPGPVVTPVALAPGGAAGAALRWVSGDVFDHGRCLSPARVTVHAGVWRRVLPFQGRLCGEGGAPVPFEQPLLSTQAGASAG